MMKFQFVKKSSNVKVGPIPVTNSPRATCPSACALSGEGGCYAEAGFHTRLNWDKLDRGERGLEWSSFIGKIKALPAGQLWRHNVSGDLPSASDNEIDSFAVADLVDANEGKRGFTYTHYPMTRLNEKTVRMANHCGFTINVSCETVQDAVEHHKQGLPSVTLLPIDAPPKTEYDGVVVATCPATYMDTSCKECGLCARSDRKVVVGFPVHGTRKNAAASNLIAVG